MREWNWNKNGMICTIRTRKNIRNWQPNTTRNEVPNYRKTGKIIFRFFQQRMVRLLHVKHRVKCSMLLQQVCQVLWEVRLTWPHLLILTLINTALLLLKTEAAEIFTLAFVNTAWVRL